MNLSNNMSGNMHSIKLTKGIFIRDLSLYLKESKTLIISDVHIGYEEALNKQGIFIPRFQFKEIINKMEKILQGIEVETIVIAGDLKHEFGTISETEWRETLRFLDFLLIHANKIILIKGNHDTILGPIAKKRNVEVVSSYNLGDVVIAHGDKLIKFNKTAKTIIIGHEHPAISIREDKRVEKFKCFLVGNYNKRKLIVLPSLNLVTEGTNILSERLLSPYLKDIDDFSVFVVAKEDEVLSFGRVRDFLFS